MIEEAKKEMVDCYDFAEFRFYPKQAKVICQKTQKEIFLRHILSEFLLLLLNKPREIVSYEELREGVTVWTIYKEISQLKHNIQVTKGELVKNLRSLRKDFDSIETVPAKGYRLNTDVSEFFSNNLAKPQEVLKKKEELFFQLNEKPKEVFPVHKLLGGHWQQIFFACSIYAALFVVALFLETAYQFDNFKNLVFVLAVPVFVWIWVTSAGGIFAGWKLAQKSAYSGFICAAFIFLTAAIILHFFLGFFLPAYPITEANFQTYPAHAAFLKDIFYFYPLGVFLIVLTSTAIFWLETEINKDNELVIANLVQSGWGRLTLINALMLSPKLLLGLTILALSFSLTATSHLFENLHSSVNLNFFMQLVWWRLFLYFSLAVECLTWYWFSLYSLKARCSKISVYSVTGYLSQVTKTDSFGDD